MTANILQVGRSVRAAFFVCYGLLFLSYRPFNTLLKNEEASGMSLSI